MESLFCKHRRIGGIPDKCSPTNETLKGQCANSLVDSSDIDLALRYTQKSEENEFGFFSAFEANSLHSSGRDYFAGRYREIFLKQMARWVTWLLR